MQAMKEGADDYISKGKLQIDELELRIQRALKRQTLEVENTQLHQRLDPEVRLAQIIGESPAMKEVFETPTVAPTKATVLITGESGTGRNWSPRRFIRICRARGPMVTTNCAALPATLLESEPLEPNAARTPGPRTAHRAHRAGTGREPVSG